MNNTHKYSIARNHIVFALLFMMSSMVEAGNLLGQPKKNDTTPQLRITPNSWGSGVAEEADKAPRKTMPVVDSLLSGDALPVAINGGMDSPDKPLASLTNTASVLLPNSPKNGGASIVPGKTADDIKLAKDVRLPAVTHVPVLWPVEFVEVGGSSNHVPKVGEWYSDPWCAPTHKALLGIKKVKLPPVNSKTASAWAELEGKKPFFVMASTEPKTNGDNYFDVFMVSKDGDSITCVPVITLGGIYEHGGKTYVDVPMSLDEVLEARGTTLEEELLRIAKVTTRILTRADYERDVFRWRDNKKQEIDLIPFFNRPLMMTDIERMVKIGGTDILPGGMAHIIRDYLPTSTPGEATKALDLLSKGTFLFSKPWFKYKFSSGLNFLYTDDDFEELARLYEREPEKVETILGQFKGDTREDLFNWVSRDYRNWLESSSAKVDAETKERLLSHIEELYPR